MMNKYNCLYCYDTQKVKLLGVASDKEVECICVSVLSSNKKLENVIRKLRDEQFMKERFEHEPSHEDMTYYYWRREVLGKREADNKLAKEAWDIDTNYMIEECYDEDSNSR